MFRNTILKIFEDVWPMILICCVIIVSIRIIYLIKNKKDFLIYQELIYLGFIIYVMCLFRVVTFQDVNFSTSNLIPFKEILRYQIGSKMFVRTVVGNMIMFIPYGFFISYILKLKNVLTPLFLTALVSFTIEITQYKIGRVFDIDDIMLNILGGIIGLYIYKICLLFKNHLPNLLQKKSIYNIISLLIILVIFLYLIGVFYV